MTTKTFDLSDVLSITTGKLLSNRGMEGVYEILNHMTGQELFTHQLPRAGEVCERVLVEMFPQLKGVDQDTFRTESEVRFFVAECESCYGNEFNIPANCATEYEAKNPIQELGEMMAGKGDAV